MKEYDLLQKCRAYLERAIGTPALSMELRLKAGDLRDEILDLEREAPTPSKNNSKNGKLSTKTANKRTDEKPLSDGRPLKETDAED